MNVICQHCKAYHQVEEQLRNSSITSPKFGMCCPQGKVALPQLQEPPLILHRLLNHEDHTAKYFLEHIQQYNAALAFTSVGVKQDMSILGCGPYVFKIHGKLHH